MSLHVAAEVVRSHDATTRLAKLVDSASTIVCKAPAAYRLPEWCARWAQSHHGKDLTLDAADAGNFDALLLPATAIVAPPVEESFDLREALTRFTRPFNTTGQPVVALPAPASGLPVGMQVVGSTNAGALRAAMWLEQEWRNLAP